MPRAALLHRFREFFVVNHSTGAFHRRKQGRFRITRRRFRHFLMQLGGKCLRLSVVFTR